MEDGDVHLFLQTLFDDETLRRFDVFEVDAAKGWAHQLAGVNESLGILCIKLDIDRVHIGKAFEQNRLALHHRLGRQRAEVPQAQHRRSV